MTNQGNIIWLASYPKSGNTWLRIFFANLKTEKNSPVDINDLNISTIASNRTIFDDITGISSSDLTPEEVEQLRPYVYEEISKSISEIQFFKIHDAFTNTLKGTPLVPVTASRKIIYIIRNPLSVAVSFAHHLGIGYDEIIEDMRNPEFKLNGNDSGIYLQFEQKLLSWSQHVKSWTEQNIIPVHVVKYEDLIVNPLETFKDAADFCELNFDNRKFELAVKNSSFKTLKAQENKAGFKEKPPTAENFFRKGTIDNWKEELNAEQVKQIIQDHKEVMKKYNYIP